MRSRGKIFRPSGTLVVLHLLHKAKDGRSRSQSTNSTGVNITVKAADGPALDP
ncbi:hypothetical protein AAMO2058_000322500 [Amorphochlora amoebiformis]